MMSDWDASCCPLLLVSRHKAPQKTPHTWKAIPTTAPRVKGAELRRSTKSKTSTSESCGCPWTYLLFRLISNCRCSTFGLVGLVALGRGHLPANPSCLPVPKKSKLLHVGYCAIIWIAISIPEARRRDVGYEQTWSFQPG
jgi:hypothetical protein